MLQPVRRDPVIMALQGGLGNQLFQWAFGLALRAAGVPVHADVTRCRGDRPLAVGPLLQTWPKVPRVVGLPLAAATRNRSQRSFPVRLLRDDAGTYDEALVSTLLTSGDRGRVKPPRYLLGYFQSPRYFEVVRARVHQEATQFLTSQLSPAGWACYREWIHRDDSVAVHVRRGDYITDTAAAATHGVMSASYYAAARAMLAEQGLHRVAWFSDDLDWVAATLARPQDTFVDGAALTTGDGGEIALMSACRVRVLANSSFSWWAGFLGRPSTPRRPVIAPQRWYKDGRSPGDRMLADWQGL